jgi:hypothetical protein
VGKTDVLHHRVRIRTKYRCRLFGRGVAVRVTRKIMQNSARIGLSVYFPDRCGAGVTERLRESDRRFGTDFDVFEETALG